MFKKFITIISIIILFPSCKKFLDKKSNQKLVIPSSVQDLQGLMENYTRINQFNAAASEKASDDYYLTGADWSGLASSGDKRTYTWENDYLFTGGVGTDWSNSYDNVYRADIILNEIDKIKRVPNDELAWAACKGHASFIRASMFLKVALIWSLAYDPATASADLGIPLRLDPDFNLPSVRSSVQQTYDQVISDTKQAAELLPLVPLHILRPSKPAAYALLARTYLAMRKYDSCFKYADACLHLKNDLKDYNQLSAAATFPFAPRFSNPEIIMDTYLESGNILSATRAKIDSSLYRSYADNDLRKTVFFKNNNNGTWGFKGSYTGDVPFFDGLAVDEVWLMRAESYARLGNIPAAMNDLNTLLVKRWKAGTFVPFTAVSAVDALDKILVERRKELLMRALRWMDIKRLNKEGAAISLKRILNGQTYTLPPNDKRFAMAIPELVIELTGMPQNPR